MGKIFFMRKGDIHSVPIALPAGYTRLKYIQSTGTQYIDTLFKPNQNTKAVIAFKSSDSVISCGILAEDDGWETNGFGIFNQYLEYASSSTAYVLNDGVKHIVEINASGQVYKDGDLVWSGTHTNFQALHNLTMFCLNRNGTKQDFSNISVYSCQIYDNGTLVRNFIPCIDPNGNIGLYDMVGKQFYGNAGTGVFKGMTLDGEEIIPTIPTISLSSIAEGSIVYINENNVATSFYVAKHNYESGLNGNGKTLLVRQECHSKMRWGFNRGWATPSYSNNTAPYWLENTYKNFLPSAIQSMLGTTIYGTDTSTWKLKTYSANVFTPSLAEYGLTYVDMLSEGSALPIASTLKVAYYNSTKVNHWTRTGKVIEGDEGEQDQGFVTTSGKAACLDCLGDATQYYVRPCFTLPENALFDKNTLEFKGVS